MEAFKQGSLDGMCGFYSIINALHYKKELTTKKAENILNKLITVKARTFHMRYIQGSYVEDIIFLLNVLKKQKGFSKIKYDQTFELDHFDCIEEYLACLYEELSKSDDNIAIISISNPWYHWSVVSNVDLAKERVRLFDSYYDRKYISFEELTLKRKRDKIQINTDETIILTIR
jgi:hypothetical protein